MRAYEGTVRIRLHPTKGITLDKGAEGSTLKASDAERILALSVEAAQKHKAVLDRWSFYVPGASEKLAKDAKGLQPSAMAVQGATPRIRASRFGTPVLILAKDEPGQRAKSGIVDIA
jgi:hypothetical protein